MKILIIENNQEEAEKYKNALSSFGFEIQIATSAISGLKLLQEDKFNLVLLDIILPSMHGLNLIKNIYKNNHNFNTPIVIIADVADDNIIQEAYKLNVSGYLVKEHHSPEQVAEYIKTKLYINK